jgi:hypothetical protein
VLDRQVAQILAVELGKKQKVVVVTTASANPSL